jgi:hypothetical protein
MRVLDLGYDALKKCFERSHRALRSNVENLRLGAISLSEIVFEALLWSPSEDFGRSDKPFRMRFRSTFQRFVAQMEYPLP